MNPETAIMILMVVTSHGQIDAQTPTGVWLEEFAAPYEVFTNAGYEVTVASPNGGNAPVDPRSLTPEAKPDNAEEALQILDDTLRLATVELEPFDAVFFPGGHGTMYDLPSRPIVRATVEHFVRSGRPAGFVCHGPAALVGAFAEDGTTLVLNRRLTAFTNEEERKVGLEHHMPFLLENRLKELGAIFSEAEPFQEHVVVDAPLVTGQNPASSTAAALRLVELMQQYQTAVSGGESGDGTE